MNELVQARKTAHDLMVRALGLLDGIGEAETAADLQQAIDTLIGAHEPQAAREHEAALETPEARRILARMNWRAEVHQQSR